MAQQVSCAAASRNSQQHRHRTPATTFCSLQLPLLSSALFSSPLRLQCLLSTSSARRSHRMGLLVWIAIPVRSVARVVARPLQGRGQLGDHHRGARGLGSADCSPGHHQSRARPAADLHDRQPECDRHVSAALVAQSAMSTDHEQHRHRTPATTFCSLQLPLPTRPTLLMSSLRLLRWDRIPRARAARRDATRAVDCVQPRWKSECAARLAAVDRVRRSRRNSSRFGLRSGPAASCRTDTGPMAGRGRWSGQAAA
eukprot:COSAG04_NODE_2163_length_4648_cov_17.438998_2_plen_255_part_00